MNTSLATYDIIAIEREYASGGNEIGKRLAKELGYKLYDRNILLEAARNLGIPAAHIENLEETSSGSFLFNLYKTALGGQGTDEDRLSLSEKLYHEEKRIIERTAEEGNCIIVGRAAGYILREKKNCLKVFIYADKEKRIRRAIEKEGIKKEEVEAALKKNDKRRSDFYNSATQWEWGNPKYFDLCMNSAELGMDLCIAMLSQSVAKEK